MKVLSTEKSKLMAEQQGWSLDYARGYVDGETMRRLGTPPALHALVGIDEFALGFRAGYFERRNSELSVTRADNAAWRSSRLRVG